MACRGTTIVTVVTVTVTCSGVKEKKMRKRYILTRLDTGPCFWLILAPFFEELIEERKPRT